jgi:hypothetical protein
MHFALPYPKFKWDFERSTPRGKLLALVFEPDAFPAGKTAPLSIELSHTAPAVLAGKIA